MPRRKTIWKTVQVPEELINEIHKIMDKTKLYTSEADFVRDAIRDKIIEIERVTAYRTED